MPGALPVGALPEGDEPEDLLGLLALAEVGIGVAEGVPSASWAKKVSTLCWLAAAHRHVVALHHGVLAVVGHRMEVEIEGTAGDECRAARGLVLKRLQEPQGVGMPEPRGVLER